MSSSSIPNAPTYSNISGIPDRRPADATQRPPEQGRFNVRPDKGADIIVHILILEMLDQAIKSISSSVGGNTFDTSVTSL
jgi:hypothetical protein